MGSFKLWFDPWGCIIPVKNFNGGLSYTIWIHRFLFVNSPVLFILRAWRLLYLRSPKQFLVQVAALHSPYRFVLGISGLSMRISKRFARYLSW